MRTLYGIMIEMNSKGLELNYEAIRQELAVIGTKFNEMPEYADTKWYGNMLLGKITADLYEREEIHANALRNNRRCER